LQARVDLGLWATSCGGLVYLQCYSLSCNLYQLVIAKAIIESLHF
jgi:hypothetical protein